MTSFVVVVLAAVFLFVHQVRRKRRHLQHSLRASLSGVDSPLARALSSSLVGTSSGAEVSVQPGDSDARRVSQLTAIN